MRAGTVEADAEELGAGGGEVGLAIAKGARLPGASGGEVLGIEVDYVGRAAEFGGREFAAVVERRGEIGNLVADVQHSTLLVADLVSVIRVRRGRSGRP